MSSTKKNNVILILILGVLTALAPFSIDMYLPAFPGIAKDLGTSVADVSLSLSSFFIGLAFGQIFYGPLLDRYGRRKPLYVGLCLYVLASVICTQAHTIEFLIGWRLVQAIGACAASVASMAMVRDFFSVKESAKIFSLLVLILGVSPLLAPTVGGALAVHFGWRSVFLVLSVIALAMMVMSSLFLPPDLSADATISLKPQHILKSFIGVSKQHQFATYSLSGALAFAGLFVYVAGSPIIFMDMFHVRAEVYGWIFAGLSIGFIGASQINIFLLRKYSNEQIFATALIGQLLVGIVFLVGTLMSWYGLVGNIVCFFFFLVSVGFANPNGAALALAPFTKNVGSASALMGALQMGVGALASFAVGLFSATSSLPIVLILAVSSFLGLVVLFIGRRSIHHFSQVKDPTASLPLH